MAILTPELTMPIKEEPLWITWSGRDKSKTIEFVAQVVTVTCKYVYMSSNKISLTISIDNQQNRQVPPPVVSRATRQNRRRLATSNRQSRKSSKPRHAVQSHSTTTTHKATGASATSLKNIPKGQNQQPLSPSCPNPPRQKIAALPVKVPNRPDLSRSAKDSDGEQRKRGQQEEKRRNRDPTRREKPPATA
ncbi:hypothetical protein QQ045_032665 [Rhodiola kirilowii]